MNLTIKQFIRRVPAIALCISIGMTSVSAFYTDTGADVDASAIASLPAADTTAATVGMITAATTDQAGSVRTFAEMSQAQADLEARRAEEEAARKAAEEARRLAESYRPVYGRQIAYSSALGANAAVKANGANLGTFKLTFYCPCAKCCGKSDGITSSGTRAAEGRTIAVDPRVIPMGSKVYIEGYGDFIAEDVGGAIKSKKIDVFVDSHARCYQLGVASATVYLMN